ncbi:hypothetical protein L1987_23408 [Smallanthus sonchifolius]|uniref:Uncharacterized protein n=1 Tax=Smallanthus sonchifolius TaxID=185202 RepID=A0ACB9IIG0_9ASTR|nr:hypothetical protein L1987_23408 [Smallanthus sonchifolius]
MTTMMARTKVSSKQQHDRTPPPTAVCSLRSPTGEPDVKYNPQPTSLVTQPEIPTSSQVRESQDKGEPMFDSDPLMFEMPSQDKDDEVEYVKKNEEDKPDEEGDEQGNVDVGLSGSSNSDEDDDNTPNAEFETSKVQDADTSQSQASHSNKLKDKESW